MARVIEVPPTLDDDAFELLASKRAAVAAGETVLVDARHIRWTDPYGMIGLLALGRTLAEGGQRPALQSPTSPEVLSYLARMDFFRHAADLYQVHGGPEQRREDAAASNVLLEITPIRSHDDVHGVIDHVQDRAGVILSEKLGYSTGASAHFSMMLSEVCQNIIEHSDTEGWVGIQTYHWKKRLGRLVVVIAVMDLGVGFQGSLGKTRGAQFGDSWSDAAALEAAFLHGVTRFRDPGRGQGLKQIRNRVKKWGGKVAIRSGSAKIADVPPWDDGRVLESRLAPFPGAQILIVLPAREGEGK
ncbi:MAG: ATP-binding protein [Longimicrobiaceae bacterium]